MNESAKQTDEPPQVRGLLCPFRGGASQLALGRLPWFALLFRRARRLRPVFAMSVSSVLKGADPFCQSPAE